MSWTLKEDRIVLKWRRRLDRLEAKEKIELSRREVKWPLLTSRFAFGNWTSEKSFFRKAFCAWIWYWTQRGWERHVQKVRVEKTNPGHGRSLRSRGVGPRSLRRRALHLAATAALPWPAHEGLDVGLGDEIGADGRGAEDAVVQARLGLGRLLVRLVADERHALVHHELERSKLAVLRAERLEGRAVDRLVEVVQQQPTAPTQKEKKWAFNWHSFHVFSSQQRFWSILHSLSFDFLLLAFDLDFV